MAKKTNTVSAVRELALPAAQRLGLALWDVLFVKEGTYRYLRVIIDKEGGVDSDDCEKLSRELNDAVDELMQNEEYDFFEVSSPGLARELRNDEHLAAYLTQPVRLTLYKPDENKSKEFAGTLDSYDGEHITVSGREFLKSDIASIKANDDQDI